MKLTLILNIQCKRLYNGNSEVSLIEIDLWLMNYEGGVKKPQVPYQVLSTQPASPLWGLEEKIISNYWGKYPGEIVLIIVMNFSYLDTKIRT